MSILIFLLYLLILIGLIQKLAFFKDNKINIYFVQLAFLLKVIMGYAVYLFYFDTQNNLPQGDVFNFFQDGETLHSVFTTSKLDYFKILLGCYKENTDFDTNYLSDTKMWFQHFNTSYLNDNRYFIRINSIISFVSFHSIHVHFLFINILSFAGLFAIYKSFKHHFIKKELLFFTLIIVLPSVLFWGSALLKESITLFHLGFFIFYSKKLKEKLSIQNLALSILFIFLCLICKPYVILAFLIPFLTYLISENLNFKKSILLFTISSIIFSGIFILINQFLQNKLLLSISKKQYDFINLSKGGIFLLNDTALFRLEQNQKKFILVEIEKKNHYTIKEGITIQYWHLTNFNDTINLKTTQTIKNLNKVWDIQPAQSYFAPKKIEANYKSIIQALPYAVFSACFRPSLLDAHNLSSKIAASEGAILFICLIAFTIFFRDKNVNFSFICLCLLFAIIMFAIIGLTTPVAGAIVRYRIPAYLFLSLSILLIFDVEKIKSLVGKKKV